MKELTPIHLLSKKSREQGRNFFIFTKIDCEAKLCAGLNLRNHTHVTASILYRWLHLAMNSMGDFGIYPVEIKKPSGLVLFYIPGKTDTILPEDSNEVLTPGDYIVEDLKPKSRVRKPKDFDWDNYLPPYQPSEYDYVSTNNRSISEEEDINVFSPLTTFPIEECLSECSSSEDDSDRKKTESNKGNSGASAPPYAHRNGSEVYLDIKRYFKPIYELVFLGILVLLRPIQSLAASHKTSRVYHHLNEYPPDIENSVCNQEQICYVTGASLEPSNSDKTWVFPPLMRHCTGMEWRMFKNVQLRIASNVILIREDLIGPFQDNSFGIDVDDNYRIVVFKEWNDISLPSHVQKREGPNQWFLRMHFRWCLRVHFCGGCIRDQYGRMDIINLMDEMGVDDDETELAAADDPRWFTELGKEVWESHMHSQFYYSICEDP